MRAILDTMGFAVTELMTCTEVIERVQSAKFDLVIVDIESTDDVNTAPGGVQVVQKIREVCGKMRVIISGNVLTENDQKWCMAFPPDAFLQKPFEQGYLRAVVGTILHD